MDLRLAVIRELLFRELRAARAAALARGVEPDDLAADLAARARCLRENGALDDPARADARLGRSCRCRRDAGCPQDGPYA